jgi:hypothetical protein
VKLLKQVCQFVYLEIEHLPKQELEQEYLGTKHFLARAHRCMPYGQNLSFLRTFLCRKVSEIAQIDISIRLS